eukprot:1497627-Karenia_brevis.AAC.1
MGSVHTQLDKLTVVDETQQLIVPSVSGMLVLGTWLESNGATKPSYEHREAQAEKAFWTEKDILMSKSISLFKRFKKYSDTIASRVLHGSGSWAWSQSLCQAASTWEAKVLRRMVGAARKPDEQWPKW